MGKHPVVAYCHGVLDGDVPASRMIRLAVERYIRDLEHGRERGLHFDRQAAEYAVSYFRLLKHSKGEWAGSTIELSPWQQFVTWNVFGWKLENGTRRFRTAFEFVPRKNGKTTYLAGIGLYLLTADGEHGPEIYSAATKKDQAKLLWEEAVRMRGASPVLARMLKHWRASDTLSYEAENGKFKPLGADADTLDGLNIHGALIDELHAHRTSAVVDVLDTATGSRRQPLIFEISTAGLDRASVCHQHWQYSRDVLEARVQDDTWFAFLAELDEGADWQDERNWWAANPNLGISVKLDDLRRKAERAAVLATELNAFLNKHLNVWTNQATRWISPELWDENAGDVLTDEDLAGRVCYGGLDLSSVSDLTAWALVFPLEDGRLAVRLRFWAPGLRVEDSSNRYAEQYKAWSRQGYLTLTQGNAVDYGFVKRQVLEDASRFQVVDVAVDRLFQGYQLSMELQDEGLKVFGFGMGFYSMGPAMKTFERLLLDRRLAHMGQPVLAWMAGNVAVATDAAGNLKPDKSESQGKIDGIVATLMALDRWERNENGPSVYESRGIVTL